jgi:hypothetical protein
MSWADHETHLGRGACRVMYENLKLTDNLEDLSADGRIILKFILNKLDQSGSG